MLESKRCMKIIKSLFIWAKWNSKYADKTKEEGMQQMFWPILAWHRIANISRTRTTGSWIETKSVVGARRPHPRRKFTPERKANRYEISIFPVWTRLPPFSVCHTSVPLCSTVILLVGRPDAIADYGSNRWMSGIDLSEWFLVTIFLILLFFFSFWTNFEMIVCKIFHSSMLVMIYNKLIDKFWRIRSCK